MKAIVAVVGRPNVGKSTFFNRVTKSRSALVDDRPGVTRDRLFGDVQWDDTLFTVVDTGGFVSDDSDPFASHIRLQVQQAIEEADAVVMLLDGKYGPSPYDEEMRTLLRNTDKPVFYGVNKIDGPSQEAQLYDYYALGVDTLYPLSAEHGYGVGDFMDALVAALPQGAAPFAEDHIQIAVIGKPNAGKSSLINRILGEERLVVSDIPGTTRDAIDSEVRLGDQTYTLVDTAGIRRKGKVTQKLEKFSIIKALRSLDRCDVALIVIDAAAGITDQDVRVAGYASQRGCGCIFLLNKWDLVEKDSGTAERYHRQLQAATKFLSYAPSMTISARTGTRVAKIFRLVDEVYAQYSARIGTGQVNRILARAVERNEPALHKGKRIKFYYAVQITSKPPTFVAFVNFPGAVHFSYERYLINQLREATGLDRTPLRLFFRQRTSREMPFLAPKRRRADARLRKKGRKR
ncbi:MAG: ribosome biogenesis GTPase Der [Desulfosarcinaceae bacterium]|nr:ribosome biogenesis GTPase Der [Desulfosarcinaceae bacterium]